MLLDQFLLTVWEKTRRFFMLLCYAIKVWTSLNIIKRKQKWLFFKESLTYWRAIATVKFCASLRLDAVQEYHVLWVGLRCWPFASCANDYLFCTCCSSLFKSVRSACRHTCCIGYVRAGFGEWIFDWGP